MSTETHVSQLLFGLLHTDGEGFDSLAELALDMRSSWKHATDQVWWQLCRDLWEQTQNPWVVLPTLSRAKIKGVVADTTFRKNVDDLVQARRDAADAPAWFQQVHPQSPLACVAYFTMEFMLSAELLIYSGGLGNAPCNGAHGASDPEPRRHSGSPGRGPYPVAGMI